MNCTQCGTEYCFTHAGAHAGSSCAEYNRLRARELQLNHAFITKRTVLWCVCQHAREAPLSTLTRPLRTRRPRVAAQPANRLRTAGDQVNWLQSQ